MRLVIFVSACFALSGCVIPYHFTSRPGATGTVVDEQTGKPIAAAEVSIGPAQHGRFAGTYGPLQTDRVEPTKPQVEESGNLLRGSKQIASGRTLADGSFRVAPEKYWGIYVIGEEVIPPNSFPVSIRHAGYRPYLTGILSHPEGGGENDLNRLGTISLTPLRQ